jgi:hypothetical protein
MIVRIARAKWHQPAAIRVTYHRMTPVRPRAVYHEINHLPEGFTIGAGEGASISICEDRGAKEEIGGVLMVVGGLLCVRSILANLFGNFFLKNFSADLAVSLGVTQFREKQTDYKERKTLAE